MLKVYISIFYGDSTKGHPLEGTLLFLHEKQISQCKVINIYIKFTFWYRSVLEKFKFRRGYRKASVCTTGGLCGLLFTALYNFFLKKLILIAAAGTSFAHLGGREHRIVLRVRLKKLKLHSKIPYEYEHRFKQVWD